MFEQGSYLVVYLIYMVKAKAALYTSNVILLEEIATNSNQYITVMTSISNANLNSYNIPECKIISVRKFFEGMTQIQFARKAPLVFVGVRTSVDGFRRYSFNFKVKLRQRKQNDANR